ncbi:Claspin [Eumeta japonica]|uniref:Claspin n=1 Tax=Eumeta variegata TaxID=151549 RepID=A0A4C1SS22_EUMVA|nr:Claspin [Eumeta japonica]
MSTDLVNCVFSANKSNESYPTRPVSCDAHVGDLDSDEDAEISFVFRNKRRICDSDEEDLNNSSDQFKKQSFKKHLTNKSESSDEEHTQAEIEGKRDKPKNPQNDDNKNSSKQLKISAKQAMENRQVIKSESNRMLRDKHVTLPYHRPKPLSLKEIMNRRRPTLMPNGTELPLKMNEEQLKHYALQLQQQQKELIELCKSDSEDEQLPAIPQNQDQITNNYKDELDNFSVNINNNNDEELSASKIEIEKNQLESQNTTSEDVDLPSVEFDITETFTMTTESSKTLQNKALVYFNTELPECANTMDSINTELNNTVKESQTSTATGDEKSDYHDVYDTEETKIAEHDSLTKTIEECDEINNSVINCAADHLVETVKTKTSTDNAKEECNINNNADGVNDVNILLENMSEEIEDLDMFNIDSIVDMANKEICDNSVQNISASILVQDHISLNMEPKLRGAPGMVINLDGDEPIVSTKMSGIELLKQRFQYFAKIKTPEDLEKEKEKKLRPGNLHSKLKQELEDKIAEQRYLEWSRRLEEEKREKLEINTINENKVSDGDDILESIEAKLNNDAGFEDKNSSIQESESEEESDPEDIVYKDYNRKKNPLIADEAEESSADDLYEADESEHDSDLEKGSAEVDICSDSDESSESSDEEDINENGKKKSRILKAFEDSDDDDSECIKNVECEDTSIIESILPNCETNINLDDVALMCSGTFSQNLVTSQSCTPVTQSSDTQKINEHDSSLYEEEKGDNEIGPLSPSNGLQSTKVTDFSEASVKKSSVEENLLRTILNEMDEADLDNSKPNKLDFEASVTEDEEEQSENDSEINEDFESDESPKNIVEYDSEENEVEVLKPQKLKRKARDFLEQEAELTSEDEWAGSGDEDEVGLDQMEREEGDDETFNQRKLRNELGQIHMRDVLDQDKREVRLLQELLLEDGDLGEGHRQRKFRWKNADGEEMTGTIPDELNDTQEEEFESEELWRKQRHERETFLRQMKEQDTELFNSNITRNTIIKANLNSKSISNLLMEINASNTNEEEPTTKEKKSTTLSPVKEQSPIFQQQPRSSLLSRGKGTLERLATLATSLAADAEQEPTNMSALASTSKRNFVFSILTPPMKEENKANTTQIQSILQKYLNMKKLCSRWIPHYLTETQKMDCITWCNAMLTGFKEGASNVMWDMVRGAETWAY